MPLERKGIDALPDEVLQHILGFLEAQEAVRTCVLSRRWRNLWKSAPSLRILAKGEFLGSVEKLCNFLDCLLVLHGGALLDTCELRFSYCLRTASSVVQFSQRLEPLVENWFHHALVCKAQVLGLYAHDSGRIDRHDAHILHLYKIPPLNSQHLTRLELGSVQVDKSFLNFSNCPLKHLKFENCCIGSYVFELGDSRTHICAPNLVSLHLDDSCGWQTPMLESMPSLVKAFVGIGMAPRDSCVIENCTCEFCDNSYSIGDGTGSDGCVFLNGLSEAKDLTLISAPRTFIFKNDLRWCPTFSKLKTLLLNDYWCVPNDFRALVCLLEHSPVLEKLTLLLSSKDEQQRETNGSLRPMERSAAILEHLKIIEVKCDVIDERVSKLTLFLCAFHIQMSFNNTDEEQGVIQI